MKPQRACRPQRATRDDRGSAALEAAILAPVFLLLIALIVVAGRTTAAGSDVEHAARSAARAAAQRQSLTSARSAAVAVVAESIAESGLHCENPQVGVAGNLDPGGRVTVSVTCNVSYADVAHFDLHTFGEDL